MVDGPGVVVQRGVEAAAPGQHIHCSHAQAISQKRPWKSSCGGELLVYVLAAMPQCHLPTMCVEYPACFSLRGMVVMLRATPEPGNTPPMLIWLTWYGSLPDIRLERVGEQ